MGAGQAIAHHLITACFAYTMIGSLVWMLIYSHGHLARMYEEPSGSGRLVDGLAGVLITIALILGWPGMLAVVMHWILQQQRRARR